VNRKQDVAFRVNMQATSSEYAVYVNDSGQRRDRTTCLVCFAVLATLVLLAFLAWAMIAVWNARTTSPAPDLQGLVPVQSFDLARYMSTPGQPSTIWREQERIPNSFESANLACTKAEYLLNSNGTVHVTNSGVNQITRLVEQAVGTARPTPTTGVLQVSFFPLAEAPYVVVYVDDAYETAIVGSPDRRFLWFLARGSQASQPWTTAQSAAMRALALSAGYSQADLTKLVRVAQDSAACQTISG
jgi:apolipoprotein D and lipocalin family protein